MLKYFFMICLVGATYQFFSNRSKRAEAALIEQARLSAAEAARFVPLPAPNLSPPEKVLIVIPPRSPKADKLRAEALANQLRVAKIPCELATEAAFSVPSQADADRVNLFMTRTPPLVFTRGKAAANPAAAAIIAEYQRDPTK